MSIIVENLAIGGYKSFGQSTQRFERFRKVNLLIGQNNCGKSNVLLFINNILPALHQSKEIRLDPLSQHMPTGAPLIIGLSRSLMQDSAGNYSDFVKEVIPLFPEHLRNTRQPGKVLNIFKRKAEKNKTKNVWFDYSLQGTQLTIDLPDWEDIFKNIEDHELNQLWSQLTGRSGGGRDHWRDETINRIAPKFPTITTVLIPAIRKIGEQGSNSDDFAGDGIIERLVKLQNPDVHSQVDRKKFDAINHFLQTVTDNETARIEIPHERNTILVHMDGKTLPLSSLGTGIHEVIILAAAATILDKTVICMEEPELHLNPLLQKKLVRYLENKTTNQYFITTHSAALMDSPNAEVYHITLVNGQSIVGRVTSDRHRSAICKDLGYHPSDLLQANCIIWVEGPSDRIYINHWIKAKETNLIEGTHYSIMFYGGRLASHLSGNDPNDSLDEFISLRRLNRRGVILIDSDKDKRGKRINSTKKRLRDEFDEGPGYTWITLGREIENYLPAAHVQEAIAKTKPSAKATSSFGPYENNLSITTKVGKKSQASKVEVARHITKEYPAMFQSLDLNAQMNKLIKFIEESN